MNEPVSEGYGHTIHQSAEENYCMGKSSKILCVKMKNGKESLCVRMYNNGEDANWSAPTFQHCHGEWNVCVWVKNREERTDCGGNAQWRECVSVSCWWSVRVGED